MLFLYILFLIYPGVSSTVLRLYVCKKIDSTYYLLTDLRVQCYTSLHDTFQLASITLILLYPLGACCSFCRSHCALRTQTNRLLSIDQAFRCSSS